MSLFFVYNKSTTDRVKFPRFGASSELYTSKWQLAQRGQKLSVKKIPGDSPALEMSHESIIIIEQILLQHRRPQSTR